MSMAYNKLDILNTAYCHLSICHILPILNETQVPQVWIISLFYLLHSTHTNIRDFYTY